MDTPETLLAYFAGFFDGEGCIAVGKTGRRKSQFGFAMQVGQTKTEVLELLQRYFGGRLFRSAKTGFQLKPFYTWTVCGNNAEHFLRSILPYLVTKKEEAELALEYRKTMGCQGRKLPEEVIETRHRLVAQIRAIRHAPAVT